MKSMKRFLFMFVVAICMVGLIGCDDEIEKEFGSIDYSEPYLGIDVGFNPDAYNIDPLYPQFAIWLEYENILGITQYQSLFATRGVAKNQWVWVGGSLVRRPGATPLWYSVKEKEDDLDIDAVSGATPYCDFFTVYCQVPKDLGLSGKIIVRSEYNVSFDVTLTYANPIYGQPSVIWEGVVDTDEMSNGDVAESAIVGHGKVYSDEIYEDLTGMTSALRLINSVNVTYYNGK
ncbi:MAG: hypothetical protein KKD44_21080 [Proteobacteria bacterium]|nr:hypothetical protein [Pseudomonadota bacterium]